LCESSLIAYQDFRAPTSLLDLLQELKNQVPSPQSNTFFNLCLESRDLNSRRPESGIDCGCFGWGEDGLDSVLKAGLEATTVLQTFNDASPWLHIPCYQRRAADGSEWQHSVDHKTCREVATQLTKNHQLCDWEYAGYCCECHGLDFRFHANPLSPWFDETFHEQCSNVSILVPVVPPVPTKTVEISRLPGAGDSAWVRLDLQYPAVIGQIKMEFDVRSLGNNQSTRDETVGMLWDTIKHYEIQIGNEAMIDVNPIHVQYKEGDDVGEHCQDCQPQLVSVDADLLMWLQFDDPAFIGKDSSNYKSDASVMTQTLPATPFAPDTLVAYQNPLPVMPSPFAGPVNGSLVLQNSHYLEVGAINLAGNSDFAVSLWFVGMAHPSAERKHVVFQVSSESGASFFRVEQNWHYPAGITAVLTVQNSLALHATTRTSLGDLMYSPAGAVVVVGAWNHYVLSVNSTDKTAHICLNSQCVMIQDGVQAADGDTYSVAGMGPDDLTLRSHTNHGSTPYCPKEAGPVYACYEGQLDEIRVYQRALQTEDIQKLSALRASGMSGAHTDDTWQKQARIPWLGDNLVLQHTIPHLTARYILVKFPVCDRAKAACNTRHTIPLALVEIDRQKWYFDDTSAWSWSGDRMPDTSSQQPWSGGEGLCFEHDTALFSHRELLGRQPLFVQMDLQNIKALSGLVFTHVAGSPRFGLVRVYYGTDPLFTELRSTSVDLSTLSAGHSTVEMYFQGEPARVRHVRIVLEEYPDGPPCISVAPIVCAHFCAGCCQTVQTIDPAALAVLGIAAAASTVEAPVQAEMWQTGHKMCKCTHLDMNTTERGFVSERTFATFQALPRSVPAHVLRFFHCHTSMAEMQTTYDHRDSKYVLGSAVRHANGHRPLISDGLIDFLRPEPIILLRGIPTVIDWSNIQHMGTPVYIADQPDTKTPCSPIFAAFVTVDATTHSTTILIPLTYTDFHTLRLFFYYAHDAVAKPVALIPVDLPEAGDYRLRNDLFCVFQKRHENVDSLCECSTQNGVVDPWGVALLATLTPVVASRIVSDSILPVQNTHILGTMRGETIRPNDHIFAQRPQPATQVPFLQADTETGGEVLQATSSRPVVVNRFGELSNVGMLYKDVSYIEDPFLCAGVDAPATCNVNKVANTSSEGPVALLHTARTAARNRWRAIELQTQESYFGAGGAGFVQRLLPGEEWNDNISIHLTPHIGINVRYPSDSARVFRHDQRDAMYHNYQAGTPVHMAVFLASKKLDISLNSSDWNWIRCGSMTQTPIPYPPNHFSTSLALAARYTHGPNRLMHSEDITVVLAQTPELGDIFHTAFASNNIWASQGGFLPDPPVCWLFSRMSTNAVSAQAPLGGNVATHSNNTACKLGEMVFPDTQNAAAASGYVRCDLSKNLNNEQIFPCMYTLGDIMQRYDVTDADLELADDFRSVYQVPPESPSSSITNRRGADIFTQKVAYGSRKDTGSHGGSLYVCHPQYNNLPYFTDNDMIVQRPNIACAIPQHGVPSALIRDCVCGILAKTYTMGDGHQHVMKIIRIIPEIKDGASMSALPLHGFVTELGEDALRTGDVLSIGTMTESATKTLPTVYFASDPSAAAMHATAPSLPGQYDICDSEPDPDNVLSVNQKNPHILDGIVVPLGQTWNPDKAANDCCNYLRSHARIIALHDTNSSMARLAFIEGGSASGTGGGVISELWPSLPAPCVSVHSDAAHDVPLQNDANEYPCALMPIAAAGPTTSVQVFNRVYVKTRGWLLVLFSTQSRACTTVSNAQCAVDTTDATSSAYDWQVQHVRTVSRVQNATNNYNIPNDAHMWQIGDLLFGGVEGVGKCAQRCPSSGEYDNTQGTIKWKPRVPYAAGNERPFWLYTVFSVGESLACKFYNCDEDAFLKKHAAHYADDIPNPDGHHPITFFEGTSITAFVPPRSVSGAAGSETRAHTRTHTEHGRKSHVRTYSTPVAVTGQPHDGFTTKTLADAHSRRTPTQAPSAASRFLLSVGSAVAPDNKGVNVQNHTQNGAMTRKITSIDNNEKVTAVVCPSDAGPAISCHMLVVQKQVDINTFCLQETRFSWKEATLIRTQLLSASSIATSDIIITSIARAQFHSKCAPSATRRLLQTETVHVTCVVIVSGLSYIDSDMLMSNGFSGLRRMTTSQQSKLSICFASERYTIPHDNVCMQLYAFAAGATSHSGNTLVPESTPPQFLYPHTTPQSTYSNRANTTTPPPNTHQKSSGISRPLIGILTGVGVFLGLVMSFCLYRYKRSLVPNIDSLAYTGVTQTDPGAFFHHGQLVYHTYY